MLGIKLESLAKILCAINHHAVRVSEPSPQFYLHINCDVYLFICFVTSFEIKSLESHYIDQAGLKLEVILLPLPSENWDYSCMSQQAKL